MKPTIEILEKISQNSKENKNEVFTRLYRYLLREDIYYIAYKHLYANDGASTKGVNNDTADEFSENKINDIIEKLANGTYQPSPTRRTYIKKSNGKMRPLGIPTFTDKLIQEILRMILEAIYEPIFSTRSHGFRPQKSCHTALKDIKHWFVGTNWFIEGDIKGCFDNIDHKRLIDIIKTKIKDAKLIQLIWKFLKAGYMENWKFNRTHSGTPQGGIISPILANIYLNELDKKVEEIKLNFDIKSQEKITSEYRSQRNIVKSISRKIDRPCNANKRTELLRELHLARMKLMSLPFKSQTNKQLKYVRYADDFIIGINGSKNDCEQIKKELKTFISTSLNMELSDEKTLITHSSKYARFLGYDIKVRRSSKLKKIAKGFTKRTLNSTVELNIPFKDKIEKFLFNIKAVRVKDGALFPQARANLINLTDIEIVSTYNAELRGLCNYYKMASNYSKLNYFAYLMEYSCLNTLASKYQCGIRQILKKFKDGKGSWCIPYHTKSGNKKLYFVKYQNCKETTKMVTDKISLVPLYYQVNTSSLDQKLKANKCELCGSTTSDKYEIHHINKVKNLKGKQLWEKVMLAKKRKTLVVCWNCHHNIIHGNQKI